jgi:hypothetical protein
VSRVLADTDPVRPPVEDGSRRPLEPASTAVVADRGEGGGVIAFAGGAPASWLGVATTVPETVRKYEVIDGVELPGWVGWPGCRRSSGQTSRR